jgi:hypothetical protein
MDDGDGRVSHGHGKNGAPTAATAALGLKSLKNRGLTAGFDGSAPFERRCRHRPISESGTPPTFGQGFKKLFAVNPKPGLFNNRFRSWLRTI